MVSVSVDWDTAGHLEVAVAVEETTAQQVSEGTSEGSVTNG